MKFKICILGDSNTETHLTTTSVAIVQNLKTAQNINTCRMCGEQGDALYNVMERS